MGADSTVVFYGLRFATNTGELARLEDRTDPRIVLARQHHLAHWWVSFSVDGINEQSYLFIGTLVGHIGHEGEYELCLRDEEIQTLVDTTRRKLSQAGFSGEPRLYLQFEPDY